MPYTKKDEGVSKYSFEQEISEYDLSLCGHVYKHGLKVQAVAMLYRLYPGLGLLTAKRLLEDYCE